MFRQTKNSHQDLTKIVKIYNDITGRNRTEKQYQWEWFESPYENKSYVILDKNDTILGHHGILTVKLNYNNNTYIMGKTENTIMQKGYGPMYFKNEMAMHKGYINDYDILVTTTAKGVTQKIREKLGYTVFANYVTFRRLVDINFLSVRIKNAFFKKIIKFISPIINFFIIKAKTSSKYQEFIGMITNEDLVEIENFYNKYKNKYQFSQIRNVEFLQYRILNNPYNNYYIIKLYSSSDVCGYLIYTISNNKVNIEDIFSKNSDLFHELLSRLFNYIKLNKLANTIVFTTLENSILDQKYIGFFRKINDAEENNKFMLKNNIKNKDDLKINNFYFTFLMTEGI